jgi:2-polyprenyl-6-methoxyphenol hydroxylase-like FAD-dependent oxidoreductase
MRILIVGGGIAGLTLAALLGRRGTRTTVVEKSQGYGGVGYVLGLWPLGSRILKGLDLYDPLVRQSEPMHDYLPCDEQGRVLRHYRFAPITSEIGDLLGVRRADLIDVLRLGCQNAEVRMGTAIESVRQSRQEVEVGFSDGSTDTFDLVVGCDGLRSTLRRLVFGEVPLAYCGWTGWAWWLDRATCDPHTITEYWTGGRFLGVYPSKHAPCCFCALPAPAGTPDPLGERAVKLRRAFAGMGGLVPSVLEQLPPGEQIWHDDFDDVRMPKWHQGRVLLIGDASAAILPTAGIGASMAMESAAALADELSRADSGSLDLAIRLFVRRRRKRVDAVQAASRRLARLSLVRWRWLARLRNAVMPWFDEKRLLGGIGRILEQPF